MLKNALTRTLALSLSLAPLALASAQSAPPPTSVFTAVDSVEILNGGYTFRVTGLVQGENQPRTVEVYSDFYRSDSYDGTGAAARCERMALLTMNKPGRYVFEVQAESNGFRCKLTRLPQP